MSPWAGRDGGRLGPEPRGAAHLAAVERLKDWTRARFVLSQDETVTVTQAAPSAPGFPPVETLVSFWTTDGTPHHFKVFKPAEEIVEDDMPPPWMKAALAGAPGVSCSCC